MTGRPEVTELRLVVTAPDYEQALRFYRDVLGLSERAAYTSPGGRVTILEAGRATLELADPPHAAYIDDVEVGHRAAALTPVTEVAPQRLPHRREPPVAATLHRSHDQLDLSSRTHGFRPGLSGLRVRKRG